MTECGNRQNPLKREVHLTRQNVCARPIAGAIGDPGFEATGGSGAGKGRESQKEPALRTKYRFVLCRCSFLRVSRRIASSRSTDGQKMPR
jgi:hypothetical protein